MLIWLKIFFLYLKEPKRTRAKKERKAAYRKKKMAQQLRKEKQMQKEASKFSVASKVLSYSNLYKSVIFCMKECGQTIPKKKTLDPLGHAKVPNMAKVINI